MTLRLAGQNLKNFGGFGGTNELFSGLGGKGHAGAADIGQVSGGMYRSLRSNAPNYGDIGRNVMAADGKVKRAGMQAESSIISQGLAAQGAVKAAKIRAKAEKNAASKKAKGAMVGSVLGSVGTIAGSLLSDETTKNDIKQLDDALALLRQLRPVSFYYNEEYSSSPERLHYGFIAQEYQKHMPDATYYDESIGKLCIDTNELIGLLVRSIQQLETRITRMEAKAALAGVKS